MPLSSTASSATCGNPVHNRCVGAAAAADKCRMAVMAAAMLLSEVRLHLRGRSTSRTACPIGWSDGAPNRIPVNDICPKCGHHETPKAGWRYLGPLKQCGCIYAATRLGARKLSLACCSRGLDSLASSATWRPASFGCRWCACVPRYRLLRIQGFAVTSRGNMRYRGIDHQQSLTEYSSTNTITCKRRHINRGVSMKLRLAILITFLPLPSRSSTSDKQAAAEEGDHPARPGQAAWPGSVAAGSDRKDAGAARLPRRAGGRGA